MSATSALTVRTSNGAAALEDSSSTEDSWRSNFPGAGRSLGGVDEPRLADSRFTGSKLHDAGRQITRQMRQHFRAIGRHQHVIFDADAEFVRQINAWLD